MSAEANLSSHLTISYSTPPAASGTPVPVAGTATPAVPDGPLGFLAALIDQLLAGGTTAAPATAETASAVTVTGPGLPALFNLNRKTEAKATPPQGIALLAKLTDQLKALQGQIDAGEAPDPDLLRKLGETANALAALIAAPAPSANPPAIDPDTVLDPLAALAADAPATLSPPAVPADGSAPNVPAPTMPRDQVAQLLASLGISSPAPPSPAAASPSTPSSDPLASVASVASARLPALAELGDKLKTLSATVAATAPDLSQKLAALTAKLDAAATDPTLLAQLGAPMTDADGTALDQIVKTLMDAKPIATTAASPQLSAAAQLPIPEALGPVNPKTDAAANPAPIVDAKIVPDPAFKIALAPEAPEPPVADAQPKAEPAVAAAVAASVVADRADAAVAQAATATATPVTVTTITAKPLPAAYQPVANPINLGQMAFEMVRQIHQGQSRFSIRLDPPELGRIDVRMHVDASGAVNARLTVERSETLDLFQRDQRSLERALTQAGLDSGKTNLEFSLKQNPFAGMTGGDQRQQQSASDNGPRFSFSGMVDTTIVPSITLYRGTASAGGVNIFA